MRTSGGRHREKTTRLALSDRNTTRMEPLDEQNSAPPPVDTEGTSGIVDQWLLMWALLIGGILLFLLAGIIGQWLTTRWDGYHNGWSPDEAARIAWLIRAFAAMIFFGGLTERVALEISLFRRQAISLLKSERN